MTFTIGQGLEKPNRSLCLRVVRSLGVPVCLFHVCLSARESDESGPLIERSLASRHAAGKYLSSVGRGASECSA